MEPRWRPVFNRMERAIGGPLEAVTASPRFLDVALLGHRIRRTVAAAIDRPVAGTLHLLHLPDRGEIRRLSHQVAVLTNEVRQLAARLERDA